METITTPAGIAALPGDYVLHHATANLDMRGQPDIVHLVQYDRTLPVIAVRLWYGGVPYTVPAGAAVNIRLRKPDGTHVYDPALGLTTDRQTAFLSVTPQMTAVHGPVSAILEIVSNGIVGSAPITLQIDKNPVSDDAIMSSDEFLSLDAYVDAAEAYAAEAKKSEINAKASEQSAAGSEANAKEYADDAAQSAAKAQADAESATENAAKAEQSRKAIEDMTVSAITLPPGSDATAEKSALGDSFRIRFGIPHGAQGETGPQGAQGVQGPPGPQGINGVALEANGWYAFNVNDDGYLILSYTGDDAPDFAIKDDGHLYINIT